MGIPSVAARTAIELGLENRDSSGNLLARTANLIQIPVYNASNPLSTQAETTELNRAKTGLAGDGVAIGAVTRGLAGEFYLFGSGIANLPPDFWYIIESCGWREIRLASIAATTAGSFAAANQASGGGSLTQPISGVGYKYKFSVLFKSDGTTPATTTAEAAFESKLSTETATEDSYGATDKIRISDLPSAGIKRLYRTKAGVASPTELDFQFVREIPDGVTATDATTDDGLADANLGRRACFDRVQAITGFGTDAQDISGSMGLGAYKYVYSVLYDKYGVAATTEEAGVYERMTVPEADAEQSITLSGTNDAVAISGLASTGVKRIYRTAAGGSVYKYVGSVASGVTTYTDTKADASLGHTMADQMDQAILIQVSEYMDFDAMTSFTYLDSRKYPTTHMRGGWTVEGPVSGNALCRFNLSGVYNASLKQANPSLIGNPGTPPQVCGIELKVTAENAPTVDRTMKVLDISEDFSRQPGARRDANTDCANSGVTEYQINLPWRPSISILCEVPKEIGTADDTDWEADFKNALFFAIQFHIGTEARKRHFFENWAPWGERRYLAQVIEAPAFDTDAATGNRTLRLRLELTEKTGIDGSACRIVHR